MWDDIWPYLAAIIPTIVVATMFFFLMRNVLAADRQERIAQRRWDLEHDTHEETRSGQND